MVRLYRNRLRNYFAGHRNTIYGSACNLDQFLDRLSSASNKTTAIWVDDTQGVIYGSHSNRIYFRSDPTTTDMKLLIHEAIHAVDDHEDYYLAWWKLNTFIFSIDLFSIEKLGHTGSDFFQLFDKLQEFEREIPTIAFSEPKFRISNQHQRKVISPTVDKWRSAWNHFYSNRDWTFVRGSVTTHRTDNESISSFEKFSCIDVSYEELRQRYMFKMRKNGVDIELPGFEEMGNLSQVGSMK